MITNADGKQIYRSMDGEAAEEAFYAELRRIAEATFIQQKSENGRSAAEYEIVTGDTLPGGDVANVLSFDEVGEQDLGTDEIDRIEAFRQSPQNRGTAEASARIVRPAKWEDVGDSDGSQQANSAAEFVSAFQKLTGRRVIFYDTDGAPRLAAAVVKSRPDTIFVHARENRNLVALVGHEWAHTIQHGSPELYRKMQRQVLAT